MSKKLINCDIGERGHSHPVDDELMSHIDIANIATGGHAGDVISMEYYIKLAIKHNVKICAHIGYPDKENFGRVSMDIDLFDLKDSILLQLETFKILTDKYNVSIEYIKFHGALYNDMWTNKTLVEYVMQLVKGYVILAPFDSEMAVYRGNKNILNECYIERGYNYDGKFSLKTRGTPGSVVTNKAKFLINYSNLLKNKVLVDDTLYDIKCDTICIHSDNENIINLISSI